MFIFQCPYQYYVILVIFFFFFGFEFDSKKKICKQIDTHRQFDLKQSRIDSEASLFAGSYHARWLSTGTFHHSPCYTNPSSMDHRTWHS